MRVVLEFNLPDDDHAHRNAIDAQRAFSLIQWLKSEIRNKLKYDTPKDPEFLGELHHGIYEEFPDIDER